MKKKNNMRMRRKRTDIPWLRYYLGGVRSCLKKLRKKFDDYDEEQITAVVESKKDGLREKLSPVLDTKQMDKWERFQEAMEERERRMREDFR